MSTLNSQHNRVCWVDIPVADLDRAQSFYKAVLNIDVIKEQFGDVSFCFLEHDEGNGGCLVPRESEITSDKGVMIYLNVDGRIQDAVAKTAELGGKVVDPVTSIGPLGFRAVVIDSEGNRVALHSHTDT